MRTGRLFLEIGPLRAAYYTGVAQATAGLAEQMLGDSARDVGFFLGRTMIGEAVVEDLIRRRSGEMLGWHIERAHLRSAPGDLRGRHVAMFPDRKTCRGGFDVECQIIHDLSPLLTPQFHDDETVADHATRLLDDVRSNHLTFCVSEATRQDVLRYLGPLPAERVMTVPLAASVPDDAVGRFADRNVEPYVLVLGALAARQNMEIVLAHLRDNREVLRRHRFVFLGRSRQGEPFDVLVRRFDLSEEQAAGRIAFPGFVSDTVKNALIELAQVLVYPALFKGAALPVLEAMTLGTPCVTTRLSGIAEAGGAYCHYFDPARPDDFGRVLTRALVERRMGGTVTPDDRKFWAARHSWTATYGAMTAAIDQLMTGP